MNRISKIAAAAVLGLSALTISATAASASVACNGEGECWHTHTAYNYRPEFGVVVHPDNWRWGATDNYKWHEHRGRGYWSHGAWVRF